MVKVEWRSLTAALGKMTEDEVSKLLDEEIKVHKRPVIARRLHQRFTMLRSKRERADIMERIGA